MRCTAAAAASLASTAAARASAEALVASPVSWRSLSTRDRKLLASLRIVSASALDMPSSVRSVSASAAALLASAAAMARSPCEAKEYSHRAKAPPTAACEAHLECRNACSVSTDDARGFALPCLQ